MEITLIFFIYGLAFYSLGLTMLFEADRSPIMVERRVLLPLAIFGFVHGAHEWMEMFLEKSGWITAQNPIFWGWLRLGILAFSFAFLLIFGLQVLNPQKAFIGDQSVIWEAGLVVYILLVALIGVLNWGSHNDLIAHMDGMLRYFLAVPGALIAGIAFFREANRSVELGLFDLRFPLRLAAMGFIVYAFSQTIVTKTDVLPGNVINTANFMEITGIPIQLIRAAMAVLLTIGLIRAVHVMDAERQQRFSTAQLARIDALQQLEQETSKREAMRREMLRHTVQAQEDERSRIARELHDDTSQTLTAFSFHLAALQNDLSENPEAAQQLLHLQKLSRQMSTEIYRLVHDLRPAQLDDLGLVAALQYLCDEAGSEMGLKVILEVIGDRRRLDPLLETALYRIVQEALTNTARHSGVKQAKIRISFLPGGVTLSVSDQGRGFFPEYIKHGGWGLAGMRERSESLGGELQILSAPGEGTEIRILIPIENELKLLEHQ